MADLDAYRAFVLCIHVSLRAAEALSFQVNWLREEDQPTIFVTTKGEFNPKHADNMMPEYLIPFLQAPTAQVLKMPQFAKTA